jgi:hypothetical protein
MSDAPQGPGWWQASDGKWYAPEQQPATPPPGGAVPPGSGVPPAGGPLGAPGAGYGAPVATLDVGQALSYGWNKFTQYLGQIIVILVVLVAVNLVGQVVSRTTESIVVSLLVSVGIWILSLIIQLGIVRLALDVTAGRTPDVSTLFKTDRLGPYVVASILYGLAIIVGLFALCIGAVIAAFLLYFYPFYILDKGQEPVQSLQSSFNLVKGNVGTLLVLALAAIVISAVSCGFLSPVGWIAAAYAYRVLNGEPVAP